MAPEGELKKRVARKLTKKRKEGQQVTMEIPERFKDGEDADEDCTALHGGNAFMNQSVFGMIAAAGSQVDFNARFDAQSSDEEEETTEPSSQSSVLQVDKTRQAKPSAKPEKHKRKFSENKLLRSLPRLGTKSKSKPPSRSPSASPMPESPSEPATPAIQVPRTQSSHAPVMSRMLQAREELSMRPSFDMPRTLEGAVNAEDEGGKGSSSLAKRLKEIFGFDTAEDVIEGISPVITAMLSTDKNRICLLAAEECFASRLYVHYN